MKIAVIGGGASGLMAAISAAREGAFVTIFEKNAEPGKKLLATGNGRCNFSNASLSRIEEQQIREVYHGSDPDFALAVLQRFGLSDTIRLFLELGIYSKNIKGGLYPFSEQASAVRDALWLEVKRLKVQVKCSCPVTSIRSARNGFLVCTSIDQGEQETLFDRVIIACGSKADATRVSDDLCYGLCSKLGLKLSKPLPALTYLTSDLPWFKSVAGVRVDARVKGVFQNGTDISERFSEGNLQLTEKGLSGIVIFQLSSEAGRCLENGGNATIYIDLMPDFSQENLFRFLMDRCEVCGERTAFEFLIGLFHRKLIPVLLKLSGISGDLKVSKLKKKEIGALCRTIKGISVPVLGIGDFTHAQTCTGGVLTDQISNDLECISIPGLYFAGEILDIDGICGGYNLQFAWSTGFIAGQCAAKED